MFHELLAQRASEPDKPRMFTHAEIEAAVEGLGRASTMHPEAMPDIGETAGALVDLALPEDDAAKTLVRDNGNGWSYENAQRISYAVDIMAQLSRDANFLRLPEVDRVAIALKMGAQVDRAYRNGGPDMDGIVQNAFASKRLAQYRPALSLSVPAEMSAADAAPLSLALWTVLQDLKSMPDYPRVGSATAMQTDALVAVISWRAGEGLNAPSSSRQTVLDVPSRDWVRAKFVQAPASSTWEEEPATRPRLGVEAERVAEATAEPARLFSDAQIKNLYRAHLIYDRIVNAVYVGSRERVFAEVAYEIAEAIAAEEAAGRTPDANAIAHQTFTRRGLSRSANSMRAVDLNMSVDVPQDAAARIRGFQEHVAGGMAAMQEFRLLDAPAFARRV
ncbi:MAG: hypothetical protein AB1716_25090, partial [Planctomycetota bacterium]